MMGEGGWIFCFAPVLAEARTNFGRMKAFYNSFGLETLVIIDVELIKLTYNLEEIKCLLPEKH
jgi:hypothetical protein